MTNPLDALKGFFTGAATSATSAAKDELAAQAKEWGPTAAAGFVALSALAVLIGNVAAHYLTRKK